MSHQAILRDATRYIDEHVGQPLNLTEIARAALTSERQLQRVFATLGATTVRAHVLRARMQRAAALLVQTTASVSDVADAVGYGHLSAFIKAFRTYHGMTPTELRRGGRDLGSTLRRTGVERGAFAVSSSSADLPMGWCGAERLARRGSAQGDR